MRKKLRIPCSCTGFSAIIDYGEELYYSNSDRFSELIDGKQAKEAGIREFVMKPFALKSLAFTIRKVLDEK
ncbi:MAG TPA: hypothetical protein VMT12_14965 [Syntrophales bacterium]|nr:hypothetical protein [Syntrophales bacterium]